MVWPCGKLRSLLTQLDHHNLFYLLFKLPRNWVCHAIYVECARFKCTTQIRLGNTLSMQDLMASTQRCLFAIVSFTFILCELDDEMVWTWLLVSFCFTIVSSIQSRNNGYSVPSQKFFPIHFMKATYFTFWLKACSFWFKAVGSPFFEICKSFHSEGHFWNTSGMFVEYLEFVAVVPSDPNVVES